MKHFVILLAILALPMLAYAEDVDKGEHKDATQPATESVEHEAASPEAEHAEETHTEAPEAANDEHEGHAHAEKAVTEEVVVPVVTTIHNPKDRTSYFIGLNLAQMLKQQKFEAADFNPEYIGKGIDDVMNENPLAMSDDDLKQTAMMLQMKMQMRMQASRPPVDPEAAAENLAEGHAFLAENATKEGVVTTESGLQYKVITAGTGGTPTASDKIVAHYRGTLINGKEFDSSYGQEPLTIPVGGVISGWTEALQLMKEGGKWELYIPANLAYREQGSPPVIGPSATLIFEIELLSIVK